MALTYGFYNSQNGDRVYDADQFSSFLDGIVYDGVYEAVGDKFYVTSLEDEDLTIQVGAGRAWLKHTWTLNDTNLYLNATAALDVYDRIDAVVLEVDKEIRTNSIKIIEGTPSDATPARPDLKNEDNIRQYPLAYIYREHGTTTIPNTHAGTLETDTESATECIKFMVGSSSMPLCSALALAGIPSGGKIGQVLAKKSSESAAVDWYDINRLPYDKWYLCDGVLEDNVVAAYRFTGVASLEAAIQNINMNSDYPLAAVNVTWDTDKGFYFPNKTGCYITNTDLTSKASLINACIFKYSGIPNGNVVTAGVALSNATPAKLLSTKTGTYYNNTNNNTQKYWYFAWVSISSKHMATSYNEGVLGCNWDKGSVWYNGLSQSMGGGYNGMYNARWTYSRVFTTTSSTEFTLGSMYLSAIAFYNINLTDAQHLTLANQISLL
jgi:hypothetical protein